MKTVQTRAELMEAMNAKEKTILAQGQAAIESSLAILQHNKQPEPYYNFISLLPRLGNIGALVMFYFSDILPHQFTLLVGISFALIALRALLSVPFPSFFIIKSLTFIIGWHIFGLSFSSLLLACVPLLIALLLVITIPFLIPSSFAHYKAIRQPDGSKMLLMICKENNEALKNAQ